MSISCADSDMPDITDSGLDGLSDYLKCGRYWCLLRSHDGSDIGVGRARMMGCS